MLGTTDSSEDRADAGSAAEPRAADAATSLQAPRLVIRGETIERDDSPLSASALVDWLAFTLKPSEAQNLNWLFGFLSETFCMPVAKWQPERKSWNGYEFRVVLGPFGLVGFGGAHQRGTVHVSLNGTACRLVRDWEVVRAWGEEQLAVITRVDCAHDDFSGDVLNIEQALRWDDDGAYSANGRPPSVMFIDDRGRGSGKTFNVGKRQNGKFLRIYEKGRQLGDPLNPWVRAEVEFRNSGRVIPWDVVTSPGRYLAGAYPALRCLSAEQSRIATSKRIAVITFDRMVSNLRQVGGKSVNLISQVLDGDCEAVVASLVRDGIPKRFAGCTVAELREHLESRR